VTGLRVAVVGGGIGGLVLGIDLRARGVAVEVYEQSDELREVGAAVALSANATRELLRLGIGDDLAAVSTPPSSLVVRHWRDGAIIVDEPMGETYRTTFGAPFYGVHRVDFLRVLSEHYGAGDVRLGHRCVGIRDGAREVELTFANGAVATADVVVGADGVHSGVRSLAFGPSSEFVTHLGGYTAYFTVPDPGDLDHWFLMYNAPGGLVAGVRPERGGTAKASLSFRSPDLGRLSPAAQQQLLADRLSRAGWRVDEFLAAMPSAADFYFDSVSRVHVGQWHRGRVVLLGDAGYCGSPLAGLGTSTALVAAYVLAGELALSPGDPAAAFAAYQRELTDYVATALELPPGGMKMFAPKSRLVIWLRSLSWRTMTRWPMRQIIEKQAAKADRITLKDYAQDAVSR
jgi:2-polyprenyl-6-methoxyphenol hydroxylase-like FAD-dependent oxidoreductase